MRGKINMASKVKKNNELHGKVLSEYRFKAKTKQSINCFQCLLSVATILCKVKPKESTSRQTSTAATTARITLTISKMLLRNVNNLVILCVNKSAKNFI